jgi:hypothetical protein
MCEDVRPCHKMTFIVVGRPAAQAITALEKYDTPLAGLQKPSTRMPTQSVVGVPEELEP